MKENLKYSHITKELYSLSSNGEEKEESLKQKLLKELKDQ